MPTVALPDGRLLDVRTFGDPEGSPVVYHHGGLSAPGDIAFADGRAKEHGLRIVAVARPGIGESTRRAGRRVIEWADDVAALARAWDIEQFSVLGWSGGGPYALACRAALGSRVRQAVTVGGMAPLTPPLRAGQLGLRADRLLFPLAHRAPWAAAAVIWGSARLPHRMAQRQLMRSLPPADRAVVEAMASDELAALEADAERHGPWGVVDDYVCLGREWGFAPEGVPGPVTLFQGAADTLVPMAHAEALAARIPGARLEVVEGAGHFLLRSCADAVFATLSCDPG